MTTPSSRPDSGVAVHRCGEFVGRTDNWIHDHLRSLPRYRPLVLADSVQNLDEFPGIETWPWNRETLLRRAWRRLGGPGPYPPDLRRLRAQGPVVLHSHFGYVATDDHGLRRALDVPWVVGFYGADVYELPRRPEWRDRLARIFDEAALVLPLGPAMAARLVEYGCPEEKITVHNFGVDVEGLRFESPVRAPDEPLRVLFAGSFREKKGIPDTIEALHLLVRDGVPVHLELVGEATPKPGDREVEAEVEARIERWGLAGSITRRPLLPFGELIDLARRCHVLVHPSVTAASGDSEGTVFMIQQMMALGIPVVATRHGDIPYTFGPHADRLVPERDPAALAAALRRYVDDPTALEADARMYRTHAEGALDVRIQAGRLADLYDGLTRGRG